MSTAEIILWSVEMAAKYGVPAVKAMIATWSDERGEITADDIADLEMAMKRPEEYFKKG